MILDEARDSRMFISRGCLWILALAVSTPFSDNHHCMLSWMALFSLKLAPNDGYDISSLGCKKEIALEQSKLSGVLRLLA